MQEHYSLPHCGSKPVLQLISLQEVGLQKKKKKVVVFILHLEYPTYILKKYTWR